MSPCGDGPRHAEKGRGTVPFCHVEHRKPGNSRHYIVHTETPRMVVEMEEQVVDGTDGKTRRGVIRRVSVPNSWAGNYHHSARLLGAAVAFFESPARPDAP